MVAAQAELPVWMVPIATVCMPVLVVWEPRAACTLALATWEQMPALQIESL